MLGECVRCGDAARRTDPKKSVQLPSGSVRACNCGFISPGFRALNLLVGFVLFATLSRSAFAADRVGQAIVVNAPFWQTDVFRTLIAVALLLLIFVLYKRRVGSLMHHNKKLQEMVSQTKAELTLAAKVAADAQVALKDQALKDSLTGLWNRRAIFSMLEKEVCRAQRDRLSMTMVMIDLDHFKNINDTHGHLTGDDVLREVAGRLTELMRPYDFAGRYGGEEFLIVLPGCSPQNGLQRAEAFRRAVADKPIPTAVGPLTVTCSLGVAAFEDGRSPEDLIHCADDALYHAKRRGRNVVCSNQHQPVAGRRRA